MDVPARKNADFIGKMQKGRPGQVPHKLLDKHAVP
jgi:hypothetical protein